MADGLGKQIMVGVVVAVLSPAVLGGAALVGNKVTGGGLIRALGGATQADVEGMLPLGAVVAWADKSAPLPSAAWVICGNAGTPSLDQKFLMGVSAQESIGQIGGSVKIPMDGAQASGKTGAYVGDMPGFINYSTIKGHDDPHQLQFAIPAIPPHDHGGENRPPFYTVVFLCKIK